jgi:DNA ligase (NAD+)
MDAGFTDIDSLISLAAAGDPAPLLAIHGIGERTAETLLKELARPETLRRIARLREAGLQFAETAPRRAPAEGPFAGQLWCVTGTFAAFSPREKAMEEVTRRGGHVSASVTSKTTHLLAGENAGSKLGKARELGATIVTEKEFVDLLAGLDFPEGRT